MMPGTEDQMAENSLNRIRADFWTEKAREQTRLAGRMADQGAGFERYVEIRNAAAANCHEIAAMYDADKRDKALRMEAARWYDIGRQGAGGAFRDRRHLDHMVSLRKRSTRKGSKA
jgi:hypothetical protein